MTLRSILTFALAITLCACGDSDPSADGPVSGDGSAAGEVIGGTISDEMLPLEQLTSTSPPAEQSASSDDEEDGSTPAVTDDEAEPAAADPASE